MKPRQHQKSIRGFTLVEIMIVVVIIGLLCSMAMHAFNKMREASQNSTTISDLRVFAGVFSHYAIEQGTWPADAAPGVMPANMEGYLSGGNQGKFTSTTPIGGNFDWSPGEFNGVTYAVSVKGSHVSADQLARLDEKGDDGNLGTGIIRILGGNVVRGIEFE